MLNHPANSVAFGVLRPDTESLGVPGFEGSRLHAEARARRLVEAGELATAGFVAFEIDEPAVSRMAWMKGLVENCALILPDSEGVSAARQLFDSGDPSLSPYEVFEAIRAEILEVDSKNGPVVRALYVAELCTKVVHNMVIPHQSGTQKEFDRETGWWILQSALYELERSPERTNWMRLLFPTSSGVSV